MQCSCSADRLDIFDEKAARRALRRYLDDGLGGSDALRIAAWAEDGGLDGRSVVEVGGGIGQIQAELLRPSSPPSSAQAAIRSASEPPSPSSR